jgi:Cd2+/Zn2+-exporting ATPase
MAAKHGVLVRGSSVIENLAFVNTVVFDKTGTLTMGRFTVRGRLNLLLNPNSGNNDEEKVKVDEDVEAEYNPLELAAAIEEKSTHPMAAAIVSEFCGCIAESQNTSFSRVS